MALIKSGKVRVFPTAWRKEGINPESSLNTEENITMLSRRISQGESYDSYVINYDNAGDGTLTFVIHGYWFEITDVNSVYTSGQPLYVKIKLVSDSSSDFVNTALGKADDAITTVAAILDDENGNFHGLEFSTSDPSVSNNEYKLQLLDGTKNVPAGSRLNISTDQIQNGDGSRAPISEEFTTEHIYTPYFDATASSITAETLAMQTHASNYYGVSVASGAAYFTLASSGSFSVYANNLHLSVVNDTELYGSTIGVYTGGDIYFDASSGQAGIGLLPTGNVEVYAASGIRLSGSTITNSLHPYATNTYNLGSSTKVYKAAYISSIYGSSISTVYASAGTAYTQKLYTESLGYDFSGYTYAITTLGSIYNKPALITYNNTSSVGIGMCADNADIGLLAQSGNINIGAYGYSGGDIDIYADNTVNVSACNITATASSYTSLYGKSGVYLGGYQHPSGHYLTELYAGTYLSDSQNIAFININAASDYSGVINMRAFKISAYAENHLYASTSSSATMYAKDIYASASNNISFYASNSLALSANSLAFNGSTDIGLDAGSNIFMQAGDHIYNVAVATFEKGSIELAARASQSGITVGRVMANAPDIYLNYGSRASNGIHFGRYSAPQTIVKREDTYSDNNNIVTLPIKSGNLVVRESANTSVGAGDAPVYVDVNGVIHSCNFTAASGYEYVQQNLSVTDVAGAVNTSLGDVTSYSNWIAAGSGDKFWITWTRIGNYLDINIRTNVALLATGVNDSALRFRRGWLVTKCLGSGWAPLTDGNYDTCIAHDLRKDASGAHTHYFEYINNDYIYIVAGEGSASSASQTLGAFIHISMRLKKT